MYSNLSIVHGPAEPALWHRTLGNLVDDQADSLGDRPCLIVPWQSVRLSFSQLAERSKLVAKSLLQMSLRHGDCVGIMAGNCHQYIEVFVGAARVGCPLVVLNNTYTPGELINAVRLTSCRAVFVAAKIGSRNLGGHIQTLRGDSASNPELPELRRIICFGTTAAAGSGGLESQSYADFESGGRSISTRELQQAESLVKPSDLLNLQFTSGTTGAPKASMLTHLNLINNGMCLAHALRLTPDDIVCCPPPLFHCFGLVLGFLGSVSLGSAVLFPSDNFDAKSVVSTLVSEGPTILFGVPTMFVAELEEMLRTGTEPGRLRAGLAAGAPLSPSLIKRLREQMGLQDVLNAYGMTETSPITFMTRMDDSAEQRKSLGKVMPHVSAKVIDSSGKILPRGERGELCTSGYPLQSGYWKNEEKTREVMKRDDTGVLWMHTGDEVMIDDHGYAHITGRIKDLIIRGGENIFPQEIEERLVSHPAIVDASVVGLKDEKYGEVVAAFLQASAEHERPSDQTLRHFVGEKLGRHKAPQYIFWIGDAGVGDRLPKTGSGKHQKHIMQDIGNRLIQTRHKGTMSKL